MNETNRCGNRKSIHGLFLPLDSAIRFPFNVGVHKLFTVAFIGVYLGAKIRTYAIKLTPFADVIFNVNNTVRLV